MNHQPSTKITVKKVKEFLWGRHIALVSAILIVASSFLDWTTAEGVAIKGIETADSQIIIALSIVIIFMLFFKKGYKIVTLLSVIVTAAIASHYIEVTGPIEIIKEEGTVEIIGAAGLGLYLALIGGIAAIVGCLIQIHKK
jgi:hypothetical protein